MSEEKVPTELSIQSIVGVGPTMAALSNGRIFIWGRANDDPKDNTMQWDLVRGPTAADLERGLSSKDEKAKVTE